VWDGCISIDNPLLQPRPSSGDGWLRDPDPLGQLPITHFGVSHEFGKNPQVDFFHEPLKYLAKRCDLRLGLSPQDTASRKKVQAKISHAPKRIVELLLCYTEKRVDDAPQIAKKQVTFEH